MSEVNRKVSEYESRIAIMSQEINRLNEKISDKEKSERINSEEIKKYKTR